MSFVGTRPEATKYVEKYSNEMLAIIAQMISLVVSFVMNLILPKQLLQIDMINVWTT